jgi:acyl-CoA synthetase (AMP-forming)/AMP-acid ligase II
MGRCVLDLRGRQGGRGPRIRARELAPVVEDVRPVLVVAATDVTGNDLPALLSGLRADGVPVPAVVFPGQPAPDLAHADPFAAAPVADDADPLAAIFYTTGTTGRPKGVMHTHAGLLDSVWRMQELQAAFFSGGPMTRAVRVARVVRRYGTRLRHGLGVQTWLTPLAVHSVAGFRFSLQALLCGHRLVLMDRFHPATMLRQVQEERANVLAVAPSMLEVALAVRDIDRYDLSSLLVVGLGGAPTDPDLVRRARRTLRCAVVVGYGATETGGGVLVSRMEDGERELAETVGRPFPGAEVKVVDEQRREVPRGSAGELACRSKAIMAGYLGGNDETTQVVDDDGWYYTGDLATIDHEGYVRILGRKRDVIIRGGAKVIPAEVEAVLGEHPGIVRAAVVGVPDRFAGEAVHAFVVPAGTAPALAEIRRHCAERLDPGKVPDAVHVVSELPVTESGEVRKTDLRDLARQSADRTTAAHTAAE